MIRFPLFISILVSVASFSIGYNLEEWTSWILAFGAFWVFAQFKRWRVFAPIGLFAALTAAGYGLWIGLASGWMLVGVLGALFAWDLSDFEGRLQDSAPEDTPALLRRHLLRLGVLAAAALVYSLLDMLNWWKFSLAWTGHTAILAALGVSLLVGRIPRP